MSTPLEPGNVYNRGYTREEIFRPEDDDSFTKEDALNPAKQPASENDLESELERDGRGSSQTFNDGKRTTAYNPQLHQRISYPDPSLTMGLPNARDEVLPTAPPPFVIENFQDGQTDPDWQWDSTGESETGRRLAADLDDLRLSSGHSDAKATAGSCHSVSEVIHCRERGCCSQFRGKWRQTNYATHQRLKHKKLKLFLCTSCNKKFQRKDAGLKHYRKHHPELASDAVLRLKRNMAEEPLQAQIPPADDREDELSQVGSGSGVQPGWNTAVEDQGTEYDLTLHPGWDIKAEEQDVSFDLAFSPEWDARLGDINDNGFDIGLDFGPNDEALQNFDFDSFLRASEDNSGFGNLVSFDDFVNGAETITAPTANEAEGTNNRVGPSSQAFAEDSSGAEGNDDEGQSSASEPDSDTKRIDWQGNSVREDEVHVLGTEEQRRKAKARLLPRAPANSMLFQEAQRTELAPSSRPSRFSHSQHSFRVSDLEPVDSSELEAEYKNTKDASTGSYPELEDARVSNNTLETPPMPAQRSTLSTETIYDTVSKWVDDSSITGIQSMDPMLCDLEINDSVSPPIDAGIQVLPGSRLQTILSPFSNNEYWHFADTPRNAEAMQHFQAFRDKFLSLLHADTSFMDLLADGFVKIQLLIMGRTEQTERASVVVLCSDHMTSWFRDYMRSTKILGLLRSPTGGSDLGVLVIPMLARKNFDTAKQRDQFQCQSMLDSDDETDRFSVVSLDESIFSEASFASSATGLSAVSSYSRKQIETATRELLRVFVEDPDLILSYKRAIAHPRIGPERLQRNVHRLLKTFSRDLQSEADEELERLAARLVSWKASYVALSIKDMFEVKLPNPCVGVEVPDDSSEDEEGHDGEDRVRGLIVEDPVDEDLIEDLDAFRRFLVAGEAFTTFRQKLKVFTEPKLRTVPSDPQTMAPIEELMAVSVLEDVERLTTEISQPKLSPGLRANAQSSLWNLVVAVGLLEPPLQAGWIRLRWRCRCGDSLFGDVKEYRAGGVNELIEKMGRSTGARVTVMQYSKASTNQNWSFRAPAWAKKLMGSFSSGQTRASNPAGCLPQHNGPTPPIPLATSTPVSNASAAPGSTLHLLTCAHQTERRKCLLQESLDGVATDRDLFCRMKQQLRRNCSGFRNFLSMRSVQGMFFVKFRLRMGNTVEVRDHNPCCTSTTPNMCECIPPVPKVEPSPGAEYRCTPAGPLATWPPVLSQDLMHMLSSPQCINKNETWVLEQLPKRTVGELQERIGQPAEGWGIYYQEGIDFDMIIGVVFSIFILASLLFGILWTVLEHDIQGAFGISSYMVTASGIFLAWMASRAKNFG